MTLISALPHECKNGFPAAQNLPCAARLPFFIRCGGAFLTFNAVQIHLFLRAGDGAAEHRATAP
jgi:hypothetical protein